MEIYRIGDNTLREADFAELKRAEKEHYWIICEPGELSQHNDFFRFHKSTIMECNSAKQHPRLDIYDDMSFGVLNIIEHTGSWFEVKEINFYITQNYLVFVSRSKNNVIEQLKKELFESLQHTSNYKVNESKILFLLLDKLTSKDSLVLNKIESRIAAIEEQVMSSIEKDFTGEIIKLRKELLYLKRYYEPLIDIAESLEENENGFMEEGALRYFKMLINRIQRLNNNVINLRDYVTQVREAYQAQVDIRLNNTMKLFTVVTTIFLPLTLIAGWYGMNFKFMPELSWLYGYPAVIVLSLVVVAVCLVYFKRHHYM